MGNRSDRKNGKPLPPVRKEVVSFRKLLIPFPIDLAEIIDRLQQAMLAALKDNLIDPKIDFQGNYLGIRHIERESELVFQERRRQYEFALAQFHARMDQNQRAMKAAELRKRQEANVALAKSIEDNNRRIEKLNRDLEASPIGTVQALAQQHPYDELRPS